jgi:biotin/methionine sulfoxide reductase
MTAHLTHWGTFEADSDGERLTGVRAWRGDPAPGRGGERFVPVSWDTARDDTPAETQAEWITPRPGTDAALMLALAQVLDADGLADTFFGRSPR